MDQPTAEQALGADGVPWPGSGGVTFEWMPSVAHLLQRTTIEISDAPDNIAVIGCDGATGTQVQLYSDDRGVCRVYQMAIGDGVWRLWRDGEPFSQRFTGTFNVGGNVIRGR